MIAKCNYGREVMRLAKLLRAGARAFLPEVSRRLVRDLRAARAMPRDHTHRAIVAKLDELLTARLATLSDRPDERARLLDELEGFDWLEIERGTPAAHVRSDVLLDYAVDRLDADVSAADGNLQVVIELKVPLAKLEPFELCHELRSSQLGRHLRRFVVKTLQAGCTRMELLVPEDTGEGIVIAFLDGELDAIGVDAVYFARPDRERWRDGPALALDLSAPGSAEAFSHRWRLAVRRQPWVTTLEEIETSLGVFVALSLPSYRGTPAGRKMIRKSAHDFLAGAGARTTATLGYLWRGVVQWSLITSVALAVLTSGFQVMGAAPAFGFGLASGLGLSLTGSINCAFSTSPLAGFAGAVGIGTAFGLAHGLLATASGGSAALADSLAAADPFVAIVGGVVGVQAKLLRTLPAWGTGFVLFATAAAIAWSGWVMTRPHPAGPQVRTSRRRPATGTLCGALAGLGIPGVLGATRLGETLIGSPELGFGVGFAVLGGSATWLSVWLATGSRRRACTFALVHAALASATVTATFGLRGMPLGAIANAATTGYFHATFFMAALLGGWSMGGRWAGITAATLEGAGGYIGFVLVRMLA